MKGRNAASGPGVPRSGLVNVWSQLSRLFPEYEDNFDFTSLPRVFPEYEDNLDFTSLSRLFPEL